MALKSETLELESSEMSLCDPRGTCGKYCRYTPDRCMDML